MGFHVEQMNQIKNILERIGIDKSEDKINLLAHYRTLLLQWNKKINLISRKDEARILERHFLESIGLLTAVDFMQNMRILDLGTGAGFPGLPIKIVRPDLDMIMVDSIIKKTRFLEDVVCKLKLSNIVVLTGRIEDIGSEVAPVDLVVCRAVSTVNKLVGWSRLCLKRPDGQIAIIKGLDIDEEIQSLKKKTKSLGVKTCKVIPYQPFSNVFQIRESKLVIIKTE